MAPRVAFLPLLALALTALFSWPTRPAAAEDPRPGTVVTVAGTGTPGYSGDNGPATMAQLHWPNGVALDAAGNLYIAEWYNNRVRKVSRDGTITTVAGTGQPGFSGDNGKATAAQLNHPQSLAVDGAGDLFISDFFNNRVRKVSPDGIITTYAGSGPVDSTVSPTGLPQGAFAGDGGPAISARLNGPTGLAVDDHHNLFIEDAFNQRVRRVSPDGIVTTVAGTGVDRSAGDGGLATEAELAVAWGLAIDAGGDLFIAETGGPYDGPHGVISNRVRKVDAITGVITTVAGAGGAGGFSGDGGQATGARLNVPVALAVDSAGDLFVADEGNYRVRKISPDGIITTVAGNGKQSYAGDGSMATETGLRGPHYLCIDPVGNLLIADEAPFWENGGPPDDEQVRKVYGVAAPGLLAGITFPQ